MKKIILIFVVTGVIFLGLFFSNEKKANKQDSNFLESNEGLGGVDTDLDTHPLQISDMRKREYPGSDIVIEQTLNPGTNYDKYIASYKSEGLKIFGLLTVPIGKPPSNGWPVIIFNHGFIPPAEYRTTERYVAYVDGFARNGYIVFKPDFRGHGNSEGSASGGYGSADYTIDVLNAVSSIKREGTEVVLRQTQDLSSQIINHEKIGMWGHSMGGHITLRVMVVSGDVSAGVIWAGVVASYSDLLNNWRRRASSPPPLPTGARRWRQSFIDKYGTPEENPEFWNSISPINFVSDISGPLQLHHGTKDKSVPREFSEILKNALDNAKRPVEYYLYEGDDHNLSGNFNLAIQRSIEFFDKYLKKN